MDWLARIRERWAASRMAEVLAAGAGPLELGMLSRSLLLAMALGVVAGLVGAAFNACVDAGRDLFLVRLAGATLLRATGEPGASASPSAHVPWLLLFVPAAGGLVAGLVALLAPGARGGGADQSIAAFHGGDPEIPWRLVPARFVASVATLATGGAGGREGPSMQLGSAIGALLSRFMPVSSQERRMLYVAGIGAGMSAVFQTPLGAAVLAAEVLYRDDFEAEALVPSVLASVVSYAVSYTLLGTKPFFGDLPAHPFAVSHLPLYALLAVLVAGTGVVFVRALHGVRRLTERAGVPAWLAPALGGLALGGMVVALHLARLAALGPVPAGAALLGGGYGVAQLALGGRLQASAAVGGLFLGLAALRILAASLTVGTGGSAGDFAPSLSIGALVGAAFGHLAASAFPGAGIEPASFAFVGMATMYGGIAHVPLGAMILVSELAGSYDLLVPLMLGTVGAHVLLRNVQLYAAQPANRRAVAGAEARLG